MLCGVNTALRLVTSDGDHRPPSRSVRSLLLQTRAEIDEALGMLEAQERPAAAAGGSHAVIAELAGMTAERPALLRGPVQQLRDLDAAQRSEYLATLRAYFDAGQDVQRASRAMFVHRNTMRYRLSRIRTLTGLDLGDPVDRLVAELQLRLHDLRGAAS